MDFIRKHYEKLLLGVVLVALAAAVVFLPFKIASERQSLDELREQIVNRPAQPLTNLDLTASEVAIKRLVAPAVLDLTTIHKVYNPQTWLKSSDNRLVRQDKASPASAYSTNFHALYLRVTFDSLSVSADGNVKYVIGVEKQAAPNPANRPKKQTYAKVGDKNDTLTLTAVGGAPDNPTNLVVTFNDSGESVPVSKEQPYQRIEGYTADIKYDLEKKSWLNRRVGAAIAINNEEYKIVAISSNEVVLSAPNQKKWIVKPNTAP